MRIANLEDFTEYEFGSESKVDKALWNCDILSIMKSSVVKYNSWTQTSIDPSYLKISQRLITMEELLREDFLYYCNFIPELNDIREEIQFLQIDKKIPHASVLVHEGKEKYATIGMSKSFLYFLHIFFSKYFTLIQETKTSNLLEEYYSTIKDDKWEDSNLMISIIDDLIDYYSKDRAEMLQKYLYLHEPYDYCDAVIAARHFAMLHEVAHYIIRKNDDQTGEYMEELLADSMAYEWLLSPFLNVDLYEYQKHALAMYLQGPLLFLLASFLPFAIHEWMDDKIAVFNNKKISYRLNPLKREMALVGRLMKHEVFSRMPKLINCMMGYFTNDVIA